MKAAELPDSPRVALDEATVPWLSPSLLKQRDEGGAPRGFSLVAGRREQLPGAGNLGLTGFTPTIWPRLARRQVEHLPAQPITSAGPENSAETRCEEQFLPGQGSSVRPGAGAELLATPPGHGNQSAASSHASFSKTNPPGARLRGGFAAPPRPAGRHGASPSPGLPHGSLPHLLLPKTSAPRHPQHGHGRAAGASPKKAAETTKGH